MPPIRLRPSTLPRLLQTRAYATHPPPARPFNPGPPAPSAPKPKQTPEPTTSLPSWFDREPLNPARGAAASERVVREGVLDPRYKPASKRVIAIICAVPIFLVTSWVLIQREFMGVEQKTYVVKSQGESGVEVVGEGVEVEVVDGGK